ncbi:hypothetical protein DMC30DRAFT_417583 [Rhodotorula diobovata]|uniref:Uncharacterized protein n=1 Tax=Rhodotorula diobovata TaxID=5288 RepID=A0A5C5FU78_9BASI|nr:hypothetical protein DMC30DRAFT_417583 [Rhodotorula diobovata]
MKFLALTAVAAALSSLASAIPTRRDEVTSADEVTKPAFTGTLVSYPSTVAQGQNISVAYDTSTHDATPHYPASICSVDLGLQGPAPIVFKPDSFMPYGILSLANGLNTGGPGGWVNTSVALPSAVYEPGEYFLIVTEHQLAIYDSEAPTYRVQSYNVSVQVTEDEEQS